MSLNQSGLFVSTNRWLAACGLLIPSKCALATSLTSTQGNEIFGSPGCLLFIISEMRLPELNPAPTKAGPRINPGLIVTISNRSSSGSYF